MNKKLKIEGTPKVTFPQGFRWGVATSGHQVEGENSLSDWWRWEEIPFHVRKSERSGRASDHWNRLEGDVGLLKQLNVNTYRFSVEWSRIEPREGVWDPKALAHYRKLLLLLNENQIQPSLTLNHFTLPAWVGERGGWEWEGMPEAFERFTEKVFQELGDGVEEWITINEPMVVIALGYLGVWPFPFPPGKRDPGAAIGAMRGMLKAHARSYRLLHRLSQKGSSPIRVGIAHHFRLIGPKTASPLDVLASKLIDRFFNWSFLKAVESGKFKMILPSRLVFPFKRVNETIDGLQGAQDFIGVNYYTRDRIRFGRLKSDPTDKTRPNVTDIGWEIYPAGIYSVLTKIAREVPGKPIVITENGLADASDSKRGAFLQDHLREVHRAIRDGVKVEGYYHWSLMDNFEWTEGFEPRFGLYAVDYSTFQRTPRPSAELYAQIAKSSMLL